MIFRVVRARRTSYDWNLVLKTNIIAWLILVTYTLAAFGVVFDVGCCHDHVGRLAEHDAIHEHVHSKNQLAVHSFIHTALLTDQRFLTSPCCCVYPGNEGTELSDHVLTNHRSWSDFSIGLSLAVLSAVTDFQATNTGMSGPPDGLQSLPAFLSIHSIILLI